MTHWTVKAKKLGKPEIKIITQDIGQPESPMPFVLDLGTGAVTQAAHHVQSNVEGPSPVLQALIDQKAKDLAGFPSGLIMNDGGLAKSALTPGPGMVLVSNPAGDGSVSWHHQPPVAKPIGFTEFLNGLQDQKLYLGAVSVSTDYAPGQTKRASITLELDTGNKEGKAALLEIIEWAHKNTH